MGTQIGLNSFTQSSLDTIAHKLDLICNRINSAEPKWLANNSLLAASQAWPCFTFAFHFFVRQGKTAEGIVHLERIANIKEPQEPKSKAHYFDGLLVLARYEFE